MLRILVVDDDMVVRKTLMHLLLLRGHMVVGIGDGRLAVNLCEDFVPDVVIVDMYLERGSGLDVIHQLQKMAPRPCVIAMSGEREEVLRRALKAGADDVLQKPFGVEEMLAKFTVSAA